MDKVITTVLLILAGVISMVFVFNSVLPTVSLSSQSMVSVAEKLNDRMESRISIVHAASTADRLTVYIWVKNVGNSRIVTIEESDVFFGLQDDFGRVPHVDDAAGGYPRWQYQIENDTEWLTGATVKITITYSSDPGAGTYFIKIIIPNGISDEYYFSM